MAIDPNNFTMAVSQAEAAVQKAQANVKSIEAQMAAPQAQISASQAQLYQAQAVLVCPQQRATRFQTLAQDGWGTVQNAQQFTSQPASARSRGPDRTRKPQSGLAAGRFAAGAANER
jgi:multidrug resistance efflux pump